MKFNYKRIKTFARYLAILELKNFDGDCVWGMFHTLKEARPCEKLIDLKQVKTLAHLKELNDKYNLQLNFDIIYHTHKYK